jgi:hypothetical protein
MRMEVRRVEEAEQREAMSQLNDTLSGMTPEEVACRADVRRGRRERKATRRYTPDQRQARRATSAAHNANLTAAAGDNNNLI